MILRGLGLLAVLVLGLGAAPPASDAQAPTRVPRIGYLAPVSLPAREEIFFQELRRLGYSEGQSIAIEYRSAGGRFERLPGLAAELVALKVDVIVAVVTQAALAAKKATGTIPIVMLGVSDPVGSGLIASLARPGGNVTGTSSTAAEVVGKQVELLRELLPGVSRVAALWNPANPVFQQQQLGEARAAAAKLRVPLHVVEVRTPAELDRAFTAMAKERADALLVLGDPLFASQIARIAELAVKHRLPTVGGSPDYAAAGILATYGPDYLDGYRLAATYVDRILKGARPAELPVEQTAKFELVINARTARALGVTIPQSLAVRADRVID
jgi:putative ABC transport system substrate-binding protein